MRQLIHNGVLIPKYDWKRLHISVKGIDMELTPMQEQMVVAWVRKLGTDYLNDEVFVDNFFKDFSEALGTGEKLGPEDVDFSPVQEYVEKQRAWKLSISKEERNRLTEERKAVREANSEKYGYAVVDGIQTEISNYTAEPSCIFTGRGNHPQRGRWKEGPTEESIELNLSPDAPRPPGNWKKIRWIPDVMWIACWRDNLSDRTKYVWLSESSALKQRREIEKFNKARSLRENLPRIQKHILENLDADDLRRRKTATVCYLIDKLKIRVGDEKDPDEADTVGASTLRPEHIIFEEDGKATFKFLGKDTVPHAFRVELPEEVCRNLKEFAAEAQSTLFDYVDSKRVSEFLDEVLTGLSAKVFRTYYASEAVENKLEDTPTKADDPDYVKKHVATMANLEAAKVCNHRRKVPKRWKSSLEDKKARIQERAEKTRERQKLLWLKAKEKKERYLERLARYEEKLEDIKGQLQQYKEELAEGEEQGRSVASLKRRVSSKRRAIARQKERIQKLKATYAKQGHGLKERMRKCKERDERMIEKMRLQIKAKEATRDYNLGTSLRSYIDPRIYHSWGKEVEYDWKNYHPKALQKKFSWVEESREDLQEKADIDL